MTGPLSPPTNEQPLAGGNGETDGAERGQARTGDGWKYGAFDALVYQCSACGYSSMNKAHVRSHSSAKCPAASILSRKCTLVAYELGQKPAVDPTTGKAADGVTNVSTNTVTTGDHSGHSIAGDHNTMINLTVVNVAGPRDLAWVGSEEEREALLAVFKDPDNLKCLSNLPATEIPAAVLRLWKGADADPRLHNIEVSAKEVAEHRGPGHMVKVKRDQFVKQLVSEVLKTVTRRVKPEDTPCPGAIEDMQQELTSKELEMPKKRRVSRVEAATMRASGSREWYGLKQPGREYLRETDDRLQRELDQMADQMADAADAQHPAKHPSPAAAPNGPP